MPTIYRILILLISLSVLFCVVFLPSCNSSDDNESDSDDDDDDDDDDDNDNDDIAEGTNPHDECRRLIDDDDDDDDDDDWWKDAMKDDDTVSPDDDSDDDVDDDEPVDNPRYDACYNCVLQCNLGLESGQDFEDGPCLSNNIIEGWVCDIVHSPRSSADGLAVNQCSYYPSLSDHKIEVSTDCEFVSVN